MVVHGNDHGKGVTDAIVLANSVDQGANEDIRPCHPLM